MHLISVNRAQKMIEESLETFPSMDLSLEETQGQVTREDFYSDRNLPPFNRVCMDGIALSFDTWKSGQRKFSIEAFQGAGAPQKQLVNQSACIEVMTGAVLPDGCDCVVRFEDLELAPGQAQIEEQVELERMQNVHKEGSDFSLGDCLLSAGSKIKAPQQAIAASIGKATVKVSRTPKIAVISTGDELVPVSEVPKAYQIRRSNSYALLSSLKSCGFNEVTLFHLLDDKTEMLIALKSIIEQHDCIILTGGVSKGKLDFVPEVLRELGVSEVFHGVKQRPGKPLFFGVGKQKQLVFGLPGNPVSTLICAHRYVLPALKRAQGNNKSKIETLPHGILTHPVHFNPDLTFFVPVKVVYTIDGKIEATSILTNGSGDFASLADTDAFIELPETKKCFAAGEAYPLRFWNQ